jgi:glucose/arabinose dehydrogenase
MRQQTCLAAAVVIACTAGTATAQQFSSTRIATGLVRPVFVTAPPGDYSRLFIVEQRGSGGVSTRADIRIMNLPSHTLEATPFLSITGVSTGSEQGLFALAFDPDYDNNGYFFVHYTNSAGSTVIARYRVSETNPNQADPASAAIVLTQAQPFSNHNGGWIGFGPDNYLYIALGDGGSGGDPQNNAQNLNTLLGKMLRIDVSSLPYTIPPTNPYAGGTNPRPEIWAYGLRNHWRNSFDRLTGDLWIGDVGQSAWEEINFQPAATEPPFQAVNYGWRCYEGNAAYNTTGCPPQSTMTFPVHVYPNSGTTNCSVTGGYVYRGCQVPGARGLYFFADYCSNRIWTFRYVNGQVTELTERTAQLVPGGGVPGASLITSFGEDAAGDLYWMGNGAIYKLVSTCYANCDGSTTSPVLNIADFTCFLTAFAKNDCYANCDGSTTAPVLNVADFTCFLTKFAAGGPGCS